MKPSHQDMDLLEKVLQGQDAAAEGGQSMADMVPIDPACMFYAANQRALRTSLMLSSHSSQIVLTATWIDGFAAGMSAQRRRDG